MSKTIMDKTTVFLLRHGEYVNKKKVVPFRLPGFPLSSKGKSEIRAIARFLKARGIDVIYSSPILRCKQTALIIGKKLGLKVNFSDLLLETKTPFEGMKLKKFYKKGEDTFIHPYHLKHGGETIDEMFERVSALLEKALEKHEGKSILIVSHGDPLIVLLYGLLEDSLNKYFDKTLDYIPMAGLVKLEFKGKKVLSFKKIGY
jgi:broad specificity phosphatase PhoE